MNIIQNPLSLALIAIAAAGSLQAASVTVNSTDSVFIRPSLGNQSTNQYMLVGQTTGSNSEALRGLFTFDFSNSGIDFSKVTIDKVTINLTIGQRDSGASQNSDVTLRLHELTQDYKFNEVTWSNAVTGTPWTTPGGSYDSTVIASAVANPAAVNTGEVISFTSDTLVDLVTTAGLSGNSADFLIRLASENPTNRHVFFFSNSIKPSITIEYTQIPEAGHVGLVIGAAALGLLCVHRRFQRA